MNGFLKRLDRYLLLNHTLIWNIKLHYILFWGVVINVPLFCFLYFYKLELYQVRGVYNTLFYLSLVGGLLTLLFWLYKQNNYIPMKEYGKFRLNGLKEYLLYFLSILIFFSSFFLCEYVIVNKYSYDTDKDSKYQYFTFGQIRMLTYDNDKDCYHYTEPMELKKKYGINKSAYKISCSNSKEWERLNEIVFDLTNIKRTQPIINKKFQTARSNYIFFSADMNISSLEDIPKDKLTLYLWLFTAILFIPLFLILYRNMEIKYFFLMIVLSIIIMILGVLLTELIFEPFIYEFKEDIIDMILEALLIFAPIIPIWFLAKDKSLIIGFIVILIILNLYNINIILDTDIIKLKLDVYSSIISFLLISLPILLLTISFIKNYMIKYTSTPKE